MLTIKSIIYLFVCAKFVTGVCEKSFFVICETLSDVKFNKTKTSWTELLIDPNMAQEYNPKYILTDDYLGKDLKDNLKWLIINNHLKGIESKAFTNCKRLHNLILYGNDLREIKENTFFAFRNLLKLGLENNNIENLQSSSFSCNKIGVVDLSFNKIEVLVSDVFHRGCTVETLKITHNSLWWIDGKALPKSLKHLHLDHNKFRALPEELKNLQQLQELTVSHNNLETISILIDLEQVSKLDLSFNFISVISNEFDNMANLNRLDLSSNRLRRISFTPKFIKNVNVAESFVLLLAHNQLRNLDLQQFKNSHVTVTLSGNPWNCECMKNIEKTMKSNNILKTICDDMIFRSGSNPYCIVSDVTNHCNDYSISNEVLNRFQKTYTNTCCDVFNNFSLYVS